jgi:hypothetical protein
MIQHAYQMIVYHVVQDIKWVMKSDGLQPHHSKERRIMMMKTKNTIIMALIALMTIGTTTIVNDALSANDNEEGGGKGLILYLTVNTNLAPQNVAIDTFQYDEFIVGHDSYINSGTNEIVNEYYKGEIQTGDFSVCVKAIDTELRQCSYGYNSEAKEPAYITVNLYQTNSPTPTVPDDQSQSQAQSSNNENNNENNNALSQSQVTTIIICNKGECKPQQ